MLFANYWCYCVTLEYVCVQIYNICVTAGTHIAVYFPVTHMHVFVCAHRSMNVHIFKAWNNLWSISKWVFIFLICCLQASNYTFMPSCTKQQLWEFNFLSSQQHAHSHWDGEDVFGKWKNSTLHSMEINSQLYEEWHSVDVERCHMRKTLYPQRRRCAQGQQPDTLNLTTSSG